MSVWERLTFGQRVEANDALLFLRATSIFTGFNNIDATLPQAKDQIARYMLGEFGVEQFNLQDFEHRITPNAIMGFTAEFDDTVFGSGDNLFFDFDEYIEVNAYSLSEGESFEVNFQGASLEPFGDAALGTSSFAVTGQATVGSNNEIFLNVTVRHAVGYEFNNEISLDLNPWWEGETALQKADVDISSPINKIDGEVSLSFKMQTSSDLETLPQEVVEKLLEASANANINTNLLDGMRIEFEQIIADEGKYPDLSGIEVTPRPKPVSDIDHKKIEDSLKESIDNGEISVDEAISLINRFSEGEMKQAFLSGLKNSDASCFLAGTPILLPDGSEKPIEEIIVGDEVQSYNAAGELVASRVSKVFRNQSKHILDVFGLMVTPGHVTFCGDGEFAGQHVPIIDILRTDGAVVQTDGSMIRAATGCAVSSEGDVLLWTVTGERQADGTVAIREKAQIRAGSRFILDDGCDICMLDVIKAAGGELTADGYIKLSGSDALLPFHWMFTESLPAPEDYVLQRSQVSLKEIYEAGEWEGRSSNFSAEGLGATRKIVTRSTAQVASGEPNIPLSLQPKSH
ncbi:hypothetical protein GCM10007094_39030 [Pseudovibrio japonicus]|uniref:Hint domain-containing protein n=1 Tax=Pseudovibrio japonicus TaxID=366534 RepID=A0ABQ3ELN5_9HYPH|nr:Hint domain-containing protein [Pseudovibrio japonicus]GHB45771.1 hypothetical protein GCM10007094_39030 [Pseudovibrio japonicus]